MIKPIEDLNVVSLTPLSTPRTLKAALPASGRVSDCVTTGRETIRAILEKRDPRMLVITGPCSIHDPEAALDYAGRLKKLGDALQDRLFLVMRTYFEKPRTTIGWKGLLNDPMLDGSYDIETGLRKAREILLRINEMCLPTGTELLDPIVPQYLADLVAWASIGARTSESQTHREMASGLSMPIGFKNSTDGNLKSAINALVSAQHAHHFLGINQDGQASMVATEGNPAAHIILRGGGGRPNYDPVSVIEIEEALRAAGIDPRIVVDCSHANSGKRPELQAHVLRDVVQQRLEGNRSIVGAMIESNLHPGRQNMPEPGGKLKYGVSITDACIGWDTTEALLRHAHERLGAAMPEPAGR